MALLQGNTYLKPVQVFDSNGNVIKANRVVKGEFVFGDLYKYFGDGGEVFWNDRENAFIVPLTEEDTFSLEGAVECQARLVLDDGSVSGSVPEGHYVYTSKSKTRLTEGGAGEQNGDILQFRLLKEFTAGGGIAEEIDPTVPDHVKAITEEDIGNWNNKANISDIPDTSKFITNEGIDNKLSNYATKGEVPTKVSQLENDAKYASEEYVDGKVAELVNSAPEMLDTLGELANAVKENQNLIDAIKVPTKTSELTNDSGFITSADIPSTDLGNYYTKSETEAYVQGQIANSITEVLNTEV